MLQVKPLHQVIRMKESVLDKINVVRDVSIDRGIDYKLELQKLISNQHVITTYNKQVYKVDDIAWGKTPESTFCILKEGEEFHLSFADYLKLRYKIELKDLS